MSLSDSLVVHKQGINEYLMAFLAQQRQGLAPVNRWGEDVVSKMEQFAGQGKVLRGSLVLLTAELYGRKVDEAGLAMAAAIELMHASLLVHDDIMDNDRLRRGQPTIFAQYENSEVGQKSLNPLVFGQALGTCFGDLGFFMAWQLISRSGELSVELSDLFGREMSAVCLAQMEDVAAGLADEELTEEQIIEIYRFKTARYTFSLPLMCGAVLAGQSAEVLQKLERLGECLGLMFQLKDDELGIFGDTKQTGKPVGSDISENKKTLWRLWLLNATDEPELRDLFGRIDLTEADMGLVRTEIERTGVRAKAQQLMDAWAAEAEELMQELALAGVEWVEELVEFNQMRVR